MSGCVKVEWQMTKILTWRSGHGTNQEVCCYERTKREALVVRGRQGEGRGVSRGGGGSGGGGWLGAGAEEGRGMNRLKEALVACGDKVSGEGKSGRSSVRHRFI